MNHSFNKVKIILCVVLFISISIQTVFASDTIKVMHYNLLNYANSTAYCDQNNNNLMAKESAISSILDYINPDIFTVNEVSANQLTANRLLGIVNAANQKNYSMSSYSNASASDLVNLIFYNNEKLTVYKQKNISTSVRDFIAVTFYYNSVDIQLGDTAFLTCIVGHLKAGSATEDATQRSQMVNILLEYLNNNNYSGNILLSGDFNVYSSSETCYQSLLNAANLNIRFFDPVNKPGSWHANSVFASYHTQSTHSTSNGCASGGGFDDRFDFILGTLPVFNNTHKVEYLTGSYKAIGQNGTAYNNSILNMSNNLPYNINQALYTVGDHLPVMLDLIIHQTHVGIETVSIKNKIFIDSENQLHIQLPDNANNCQVKIIDPLGKIRFENNFQLVGNKTLIINLSLQPGLYFVVCQSDQRMINKKVYIR